MSTNLKGFICLVFADTPYLQSKGLAGAAIRIQQIAEPGTTFPNDAWGGDDYQHVYPNGTVVRFPDSVCRGETRTGSFQIAPVLGPSLGQMVLFDVIKGSPGCDAQNVRAT